MTAGPLALVGTGEWSEECAFDADLLAESANSTVTVLLTAAAYERPELAAARAAEHFARLGAVLDVLDVLDRSGACDEAQAARVREARFIYVASGSAMHLLSVLKSTPVWEALVEAHHNGAVVAAAGSSASVLCADMVDPRGGGFGVGLGLVRGLSLIPRYEQWSAEKSRRTIQMAPKGLILAGVPAASALIRSRDGRWVSAGSTVPRLFRDGLSVGLDVLND